MNLYWCSPLLVCRLLLAESYNSLSRSPISPGRELQSPISYKDHVSLIFRLDPRRSNGHQVYENKQINRITQAPDQYTYEYIMIVITRSSQPLIQRSTINTEADHADIRIQYRGYTYYCATRG